ncbi:MAG: hypothetical protein ABFS41_18320 [Myxococcota bacterium]
MKIRGGPWIAMLAALALAAAAGAEDFEAPDVAHDAGELEALLEDSVDAPRAETALVFSSGLDEERRVVCRARNARGEAVGHAAVRVPARGVGFLLASDFSGGEPFAGQVTCLARRGIRASGFLRTAGGLTALPGVGPARGHRIRFPIVATR